MLRRWASLASRHVLHRPSTGSAKRFAVVVGVVTTATALAGGAVVAHCDEAAAVPPGAKDAPSAASGITEHGEVTLDALVGRSLAHLRVTTGTVTVRGLEVRWWRYEDPDNRDKPPVVGLHGGPSMTHLSVKPLALLADRGHPVILYDQAGCGESSYAAAAANPARDTPWLLTVDYYVEEVYAMLAAHQLGPGAGNGYYVYGLSWGSMLAQEFAVTQPEGLRGLVLSGALCDGDVYIKTQWRDRIATLPTFTQKLLRELEDAARYDTAAYRRLDAVLSTHFTTRQVPHLEGARDRRANLKIYAGMQGESEFTFGGVLAGWTVEERNATIAVPTLVLAGEFDTMTVECHQQVVDSIPTAWPLVVVPRAAHCKLLDEPEIVVNHVAKFVHTCEATRKIPPCTE